MAKKRNRMFLTPNGKLVSESVLKKETSKKAETKALKKADGEAEDKAAKKPKKGASK